MEAKLKHLEFIQSTINRMAGNSFLLKGWAVTIVGGLLAFSFKELDRRYVYIAVAIIFFFWLLDAYYLSRERHFIKLYEKISAKGVEEIDFSMNTDDLRHADDWFNGAVSTTLFIFYGGLVAVSIFIVHYL